MKSSDDYQLHKKTIKNQTQAKIIVFIIFYVLSFANVKHLIELSNEIN